MEKITKVDSEQGRTYFVDSMGIKLPSSTTVLNINEKYGLHHWMTRTAVESFVNQLIYEMHTTGKDMMTKDFLEAMDIPLMMDKAKKRPKEVAEEGAEKGTQVHAMIEEFFTTGKHEQIPLEFKEQIKKFHQWRWDYCVEPIEVEKTLFSKRFKFAGTTDLVAKLSCPEEKIFVIDFKTANGLYHDHKLQLASYFYAWEEMTGKKADMGGMLRIDKYTGEIEWHTFTRPQLESFYAEFLNFVEIWWLRNSRLKGRKK